MKLEELLQAIIDKNYPHKFRLTVGVCRNVAYLLTGKEEKRLRKAIAALYTEKNLPGSWKNRVFI